MGNNKKNGNNRAKYREIIREEIEKAVHNDGSATALFASVLTALLTNIADSGAIDLVHDDGSLVRVLTRHIDEEKEKILSGHREGNPLPMTSSYGYPRVIKTGKSQFIPGVSERIAGRLFPEAQLVVDGLAIRSYVCVPLVARGHILGALTLLTTGNGRSFDGEDLLFIEEIASMVAEELDRRLRIGSDGKAP